MVENKTPKTENYQSGQTPLAREHARRRRKKRRGPSKAVRYTAAVLTVILVFFVAYSIGSWAIRNFSSSKKAAEDQPEDDPVTTLQKRLDELTTENKMLSGEIKELQAKVDKYNALYGPIDGSLQDNSDSSQSGQAQSQDTQSSSSSQSTSQNQSSSSASGSQSSGQSQSSHSDESSQSSGQEASSNNTTAGAEEI